MIVEFLDPDFSFDNEAGSLRQLVHGGWSQVNVVCSVAGSVRGGHHHEFNRELFYVVSGAFSLEISRDGEFERHEMKAGHMFVVPPFADHTFAYGEDTVLVAMYDRGVELEGGAMDIVAQERDAR